MRIMLDIVLKIKRFYRNQAEKFGEDDFLSAV